MKKPVFAKITDNKYRKFVAADGRKGIVLNVRFVYDTRRPAWNMGTPCLHNLLRIALLHGSLVAVKDPFTHQLLSELWRAGATIGAALEEAGRANEIVPTLQSEDAWWSFHLDDPAEAKAYLWDLHENNGPFIQIDNAADSGDGVFARDTGYRPSVQVSKHFHAFERGDALGAFGSYGGREMLVFDEDHIESIGGFLSREAEGFFEEMLLGGSFFATPSDTSAEVDVAHYVLSYVWDAGLVTGVSLERAHKFEAVFVGDRPSVNISDPGAYLEHLTNGQSPIVSPFGTDLRVI